ncbi:molybdopterin-dependent oxidoreductase [Georgenia sp. 10Sc9-8]|uniref:Molybdopterin-dependent oxidoreductase n=1 Tax=Georgenia halotolerans TaxID=3028317 RepID=A0ABT5TWJ6_9MICO|nr:molybdopterin-dependent oxidoreductase [Georgenia halotolerans]
MSARGGAGLLGVVVTGGAVLLAEILAALAGSGPGPVEAVAERFIDHTPAWLKDLAIAAFGTWDKLALSVGIAVVMTLLAVLAGRSEYRRRWAGAAVVLGQGLVAALAIFTHPQGGLSATWPVLVGSVVGALVLSAVLAPPERWDPGRAMADRRVLDRRSLLIGAGVLGAAALVGAGVTRVVQARRPPTLPRALPSPATPARPVPAGATFDVRGLTPFRTPNADFYRIDTAFFAPQVDAASWELRVHGLVDQEVRMTLEDLLEEPMTEAWVTLACVSNEVGGDLVGNARWLGIPVRDVLSRAGVQEAADMVLSRSTDGFSASTPLAAMTDDRNALIAVGMNGEPLPPEHGYPVRLVVPGLYGYVSATKWLAELEVTRFADASAYWTDRGWSERGPVKISSRIDTPAEGADLAPGEVVVAGMAWNQHTGIAEVEVRVDDGEWLPARLAEDVNVDTWTQWLMVWDATPGEHRLQVRATGRDGEIQTGERTGVVPDGATGWHEVRVIVA